MVIAMSIYILICYLFIEIRYNLYTIFVLFIIEKEKIKTDCCYFFMVVLSQIKTCYFYTFRIFAVAVSYTIIIQAIL